MSGPTPQRRSRPGAVAVDERDDELVQPVDLPVEEVHAPAQFPQRDADRVRGGLARPGPQGRDRLGQRGRGVPGEPFPQVIGPGQDQRPGLVDRLGPLVAGAAPVGHQRPDRLHRAVPALGPAGGPAGLRGPGGADRVQRIGFALAPPVLPVGAVHLHDLDVSPGQVPAQARSVAARSLDADYGDVPELRQPAQQTGIPRRRRREFLHAQ